MFETVKKKGLIDKKEIKMIVCFTYYAFSLSGLTLINHIFFTSWFNNIIDTRTIIINSSSSRIFSTDDAGLQLETYLRTRIFDQVQSFEDQKVIRSKEDQSAGGNAIATGNEALFPMSELFLYKDI